MNKNTRLGYNFVIVLHFKENSYGTKKEKIIGYC